MEKKSLIEQQGLGQIKIEDKKSWVDISLIWAGGLICVPALMVGGFLTAGMGFKSSIIAMVLGYLIVVCYMIFIAMQAEDMSVPAVVTFEGAFGKNGSRFFASAIILVCFTGWFAFQTAVCGIAFSSLLGMYGVNISGVASMIIWGSVMFISAVYGFRIMKWLNAISLPAMIAILVYAMFKILSVPESVQKIIEFQPENPMPLIAGIGIVVGGFAAGSVLAGDITRYAINRKQTITAVIVGILPAGIGTLIAGAVLALHAGSLGMDNTSLVNMLLSVGAPVLGLLVLILATWTTNVSNAYTAGFALLNLTRMDDNKRSLCTVIVGVMGTLLAVFGVMAYFGGFLNILAAFIPPIAGVVIVDYWILKKGDVKNWYTMDGFNVPGFLSWIIGAGVAILFPTVLIPSINAIVVAGVSYMIIATLFIKKPVISEVSNNE